MKKRLDVLLVERGLAESRTQAQALVLAGLVTGHDKPGEQVDDGVELELKHRPPYVSRGGEKLAHALDAFGIDPSGLDCIDIGASTGGFTDVLLQRGAARVAAVDVGYGQLHERLRGDERVTVLERTNARALDALPFAPSLVVCDVSFISRARRVAGGSPPRGAGLARGRAREAAVRGGARGRRQRRCRARRRRAREGRSRGGRGRTRLGGVYDRRRRLRAPGPKGQPGAVPSSRAGRSPDASP